MTKIWRVLVVVTLQHLISLALGQYTPLPRWGQAVALLENILYVHGGLTDQYDQYSYTSAPPTSEVLLLDLSMSFSAISPPWQLLSNATTISSSPALGWHTLSAFNTSSLLLFGGQPGPNSQTVLSSLNDSAALVSVYDLMNPSFVMKPQNWAGEPIRRMRHSASSTGGKIWIIGGEKADGSGNSFSDHYVFDPVTQAFAILPSGSNAPPDIYGHASLVLPDGRLLVFGGYCVSCGNMIPLNTIWSLDTTQAILVWDMVAVSASTLPNARRDFAAVVLATGEILIHGGGDSTLQMTYSDGWILDTTQNPMVWQEIQSLQQLGARKDHMAVQCNGQVVFAFGYGSSAPTSASVQIYDTSSSSMVPSYSPPPAGSTPATNTLPAPGPSQTDNSGSGGPVGTGSASTTRVDPTSTTGTSADSSSNKNNVIAIALGTTFGVLGLVAGGLATFWYLKRSRGRVFLSHGGRFSLLGGDPEHESADTGVLDFSSIHGSNEPECYRNNGLWGETASPLAAVLTHIGLSKHNRPEARPRRDMFADEDTQQFGLGDSLPGMSRREGSSGTSSWSLHSMGAIVRGMISREPSTSNSGREWDGWEKNVGDREEPIHEDKSFSAISYSGSLHGPDKSSWSCTDPFADPAPNDTQYDPYQPHLGVLEPDAEDNNVKANESGDPSPLHAQRTLLAPSTPVHALSPLREVSHITEFNASTPYLPSSPDDSLSKNPPPNNVASSQPGFPSQLPSNPSSPHISYASSSTIALSQRNSSIPNSYPPTSHPVHRSDSWWGRFMKTPLLDRRSSISQKPLDFRDPNCAPRFMLIEESTPPLNIPNFADDAAVKHDRVASSSVRSGQTANTEAAERLGGKYDVIQRVVLDGSASHRSVSISSVSANEVGWLGSSEHVNDVSVSSKSLASDQHRSSKEYATPSRTESSSTPGSQPTMAAGRSVTSVSSKVQELERRITDSLEVERSPPPRNTRKREEVPSRSRPNIKYGLAPRPSLYVTNPDNNSLPAS